MELLLILKFIENKKGCDNFATFYTLIFEKQPSELILLFSRGIND
jgi:hypothetical protein